MLRIIKNPNKEIYEEATQRVKENGGYCPCMISKNEDTKCVCREFRESVEQGECHCGRYVKVEN